MTIVMEQHMNEEETEVENDAESAIDIVESVEREAAGGRRSRSRKSGRWIMVTEEQLEAIPREEENFMGKCVVCTEMVVDSNSVDDDGENFDE